MADEAAAEPAATPAAPAAEESPSTEVPAVEQDQAGEAPAAEQQPTAEVPAAESATPSAPAPEAPQDPEPADASKTAESEQQSQQNPSGAAQEDSPAVAQEPHVVAQDAAGAESTPSNNLAPDASTDAESESAPVPAVVQANDAHSPDTAEADGSAPLPSTEQADPNPISRSPTVILVGDPSESGGGQAAAGNLITDRKAAIQEALRMRKEKQPKVPPKEPQAYKAKAGQPFGLTAPTFDTQKPNLADLGVGISLYFRTLYFLAIIYMLMFIAACPSLIMTFLANPNAVEEAAEDDGALATLKVFTIAAMFKADSSSEYGCDIYNCTLSSGTVIDTQIIASIMVWFDLLGCLVFFLAIPVMETHFEELADMVDEHNITASDYAVWVWGIPPDATEDQIAQHFNKYDGSVCPTKIGTRVLPFQETGQQPVAPDDAKPEAQVAPAAEQQPSQDVQITDVSSVTSAEIAPTTQIPAQPEGTIELVSAEGAVPSPEPPAETVSGSGFGAEAADEGPTDGVAAVYIARRDAETFKLLKKRIKHLDKQFDLRAALNAGPKEKTKAKLESKLEKLQAKLDKEDSKLKQMADSGKVNDAICAFVVFNSQKAQLDCLRHYKSNAARHAPLFCHPQEDQFRLPGKDPKGHVLTVRPAPEPSTIVWENLEVTVTSRAIRKLLSSSLSFIIIIVSFAVIVAGKSYQETLKDAESLCTNETFVGICNRAVNWDYNITDGQGCPDGLLDTCTLADAWNATTSSAREYTPLHLDEIVSPSKTSILVGEECRYDPDENYEVVAPSLLESTCASGAIPGEDQWQPFIDAGFVNLDDETTEQCTKCYCTALMNSAPVVWGKSFDFGSYEGAIRDGQDEAFCTQQAEAVFYLSGLQVAAVLLVVVFNTLMKTSTQMLAFFEKHHTLDEQEESIAIAVFIGQFINTGLVALIVYAHIPAVVDSLEDSAGDTEALDTFPLFAGPFEDFGPDWYSIVGAQIMTTVIVNVILPAVPLFTDMVMRCLLPCFTSGIVTQAELNTAYRGSEFLLSSRYGMLMNGAFVTFMYASGIPILLIIGVLVFAATFWIDKIYLLRYATAPPQYDAKLAISMLRMFKFAIIIHLMIGCWVFSAGGEGSIGFPRPVLSDSIEEASEEVLKESFGCHTITSEDNCEWSDKCEWIEDDSIEEGGLCIIDTESAAYQNFESFNFFPRLLNAVVFPYFCITVLALVHQLLRLTPLRPAVDSTTSILCKAVVKLYEFVQAKCCKSGSKVHPEEKEDGDHGMPSYSKALAEKRFGVFPSNYDVTTIGKYHECLSWGDNLQLFRKVSPSQKKAAE